ncbi:DUF3311 domain-containing protein [Streptomyces sp. SL13]|uniref:DUF3311 domain-containing protein n=1 Tax=Streptantibioticus silvisoli TaxID=2705255 RepID=A0AA90H2Z4_9ACTN|nr:DUF3311 domain-containing protein [Streptantibioticus silvisoli]MDI5966516.1 DUF3311 domain-containing protein [Streptantibioticus silvisoli]MDI5970366.1 DUF3311 domain-containing protein [Streptantibioticus silvisoli]
MTESSRPPARGPVVTVSRVIAGICLIAPFVAMLWVSSYARVSPQLIGLPFFYWYQMAWVIGSAALISVAYALVRREERARRASAAAPKGDAA